MTSATTTTDSVDIASLDASPVPNQMITSGASATTGIEPSATMNGWTTFDTNREYHSSSPSTVPMALPSKKPSKVSMAVTLVSCNRLPSCCILTRKVQISAGDPNRKALSACLEV